MADHFDLILKGGTVVNHDGEGVRDIGITGGRRRPPSRVAGCIGTRVTPISVGAL